MESRSTGQTSGPDEDGTPATSSDSEVEALVERLLNEQLQPLESRMQAFEQELARLLDQEELLD